MTTTRIGVVIDALVSLLAAEDGKPLQKPVVGTDVLYIGWDGTTDSTMAGGGRQEWAGIGNRARNEELSIPCYAEHTSGDTKFKTSRDVVLARIATVESTLRSDPTLGGVLPSPGWAWFASLDQLIQDRPKGVLVGAVFTLSAFSRL